jgi:hypothetical protein
VNESEQRFAPLWMVSQLVNRKSRVASFWTDLIMRLRASPCSGGDHVIRTVALGVVCLAGLGAIAAAAKKSPPPLPEVVMPVVAGNKADRLPLIINQDTPIEAEKVDVVFVPPSEQSQAGLPPPAPKEVASPQHRVIIPRHWHDPHDLKAKAAKQRESSTKQANKRSADQPPKEVSGVKVCRSDGLDPLLRKLKLSPPCDS